MATRAEVIDVLGMLMDAFPSYRPNNPDGMIQIYTGRLQRFDAEALRQAAEKHIDGSRFFPAVAELVRLAENAQRDLANRRQGPRISVPSLDDPFDAACWAIMRQRGISDPGQLSEAEIHLAYQTAAQVDESYCALLVEVAA